MAFKLAPKKRPFIAVVVVVVVGDRKRGENRLVGTAAVSGLPVCVGGFFFLFPPLVCHDGLNGNQSASASAISSVGVVVGGGG